MSNEIHEINFEEAIPSPEFLIKSIAEQGYSLETAIADLMDNSISANADHIEVLVDPDQEPFTLFIADNGDGMNEKELKKSMQFPSSSLEEDRNKNDLGRFGLGLKTASFSQTRRFTVLSRKKGDRNYCGRTWDVNYLQKCGAWKIIVNNESEIKTLLNSYSLLSRRFNNSFENFSANTIIIWQGLYKFEEFLNTSEVKRSSLKDQISAITSEHLSIVFHRFLERKNDPLTIRVNNRAITPFNPFPTDESDFRSIDNKQTGLRNDVVKLEGFVLPSRSIDESKEYSSVWTTPSKGLMDLEGIYVYRADRIIVFGGWNDITRKTPTLRLARLRVEVGNKVDNLFHLNVAKSKIIVPFDIRTAFIRYVAELKVEAEREYNNRGIRRFAKKGKGNYYSLFEKNATDKGLLIEINSEFPLLSSLRAELTAEQNAKLNFMLKIATTTINNTRRVQDQRPMSTIEEDKNLSHADIATSVRHLQAAGVPDAYIRDTILPELGFSATGNNPVIEDLFK
ncbi:ATP-binding protein [Pedobacter africanus]|uniref:Histidine kinase-, DNA gyrase B-, and HSP90-like ATPase n=1 Tax=Pedobacter africanus TaxID=151894 RepID=A0A1W2CRI3_9SPHI|nr:ATP-binding protein [Pedobacter africanus]SMC87813.1 Histidine kinase-, DNA gyrase B-, and HSP90-like ATPase [Pedobacter africanus]